MSDEPIRAYIGNYEIGTTDLLIPVEALRRANDEIDRERERRRREAEEQVRAAEAARKPSLWGRVLAAMLAAIFFGRRRP